MCTGEKKVCRDSFLLTIKLMELINGIVTLTLSDSLVPLKSAVSF